MKLQFNPSPYEKQFGIALNTVKKVLTQVFDNSSVGGSNVELTMADIPNNGKSTFLFGEGGRNSKLKGFFWPKKPN